MNICCFLEHLYTGHFTQRYKAILAKTSAFIMKPADQSYFCTSHLLIVLIHNAKRTYSRTTNLKMSLHVTKFCYKTKFTLAGMFSSNQNKQIKVAYFIA